MLATPELIRETAQVSQLAQLVPRWQNVPLYRDMLARVADHRDGHSDLTGFTRLPLITKREMRAGFPENFLGCDHSLDALLREKLVEVEHTSGTSEERLPVIFGRGWWNEQEERALRLNAFVARLLAEHPNARRATINSPACNGLTCPTVWQSRAHRTIGNTLFVNLARIPFLLSDADLARMVSEIAEWSPQFIDVDPVHGARFALYCERHGLRFPALRFVLCSYEFVSVVHRRVLERVFGVPVFNLYGSTETGHLLMENERGEMKPCYDNAYLEIVEADNQDVGGLVVTTLTNDYMPLLRYWIGDLAQRHGLPQGTVYTVHGRARDALSTPGGERVTTWQVDQCFAGEGGIAHYELRQNQAGECRLRFVPDGSGPTADQLSGVTERLEALLKPPGGIETESMQVLVPSPSGKFRLTHRTGEP
jgi:phenylacetate-CoA ligase